MEIYICMTSVVMLSITIEVSVNIELAAFKRQAPSLAWALLDTL